MAARGCVYAASGAYECPAARPTIEAFGDPATDPNCAAYGCPAGRACAANGDCASGLTCTPSSSSGTGAGVCTRFNPFAPGARPPPSNPGNSYEAQHAADLAQAKAWVNTGGAGYEQTHAADIAQAQAAPRPQAPQPSQPVPQPIPRPVQPAPTPGPTPTQRPSVASWRTFKASDLVRTTFPSARS